MDVRPGPSSFQRLTAVSAAVVVLSCFGAFVGLAASSLWADELFTAYFADPAVPNVRAALARAAEDVSPPGYYLLLWQVLRITELDFVTVSRGLSALLGCIALVGVILAPGKPVGLTPRLFAAAFAATTTVWFLQSQEARAYALVIPLIIGMAACALRCLETLRAGKVPTLPLVGLALLSLAASLCHYYAILVAGAVFTLLLLFCRSPRAVGSVIVSGALVLVPFIAFLVWHQPQVVVDVALHAEGFDAIEGRTSRGIAMMFGGWRPVLLLLALSAIVIWTGRTLGSFREVATTLRETAIKDSLILLIGSMLLAYFYAFAVSLAYVPMLSVRFFNFLAPLSWVAMAYLAHAVLTLAARSDRSPIMVLTLSAAVLISGTKVLERGWDRKQPWRQTAQAVAELPSCVGATLPVIWWDRQFISDDTPEHFYGYYLDPDPRRQWLTLNRKHVLDDLGRPEMRSLIRDTAEGRRTCPLLLWSVHMTAEELPAVADALEAQAGRPITIAIHRPRHSEDHGFLFLLE